MNNDGTMSTKQDGPMVEECRQVFAEAPPRFQFGLGTLFWITAATAILCALWFIIGEFAIPIMLFISVAVLPAVWTTLIIYGRGYQRTFGIGAMFPSGFLMFSAPRRPCGSFFVLRYDP